MAHEDRQQVEFGGRQFHQLVAPPDLAFTRQQPQLADRQAVIGGRLAQLATAQQGADACQQHPRFARLADVVVGADLQAQHLVVAVVQGGEHQDRQARLGRAQLTADLQAVQPRQHDVEHHQVRAQALHRGQRLVAATDHRHGIALTAQVGGDELGQGGVVFDNEQGDHGRSSWRKVPSIAEPRAGGRRA